MKINKMKIDKMRTIDKILKKNKQQKMRVNKRIVMILKRKNNKNKI